MKRLLTAGIFGTILGIVGTGTANASIVSSGFLDEKLTEYALSTSLDLKANQSDLTALSNKIGTLPSEEIGGIPGLELLFPGLNKPFTYPTSLAELITAIYGPPEDGGAGLLGGIIGSFRIDINDDGNVDRNVGIIPNFVLANDAKNLANANATKIGTLPDGITVQGMYEGWTDSTNKITYSGLNTISQDYAGILDAFGTSGLTSLFLKGGTITIPGYSTNTILPYPELSYGVSKIGDLPSGNLPTIPEHVIVFPELNQPLTYPTSLAELITALYGNSETDSRGLLAGIIGGFPFDTDGDGQKESNPGLIPNLELAKNANDLATANATKIGTVPSGKNLAGMISETDAKIGTLPAGYDSVGAALTAIKGIAEDAKAAALAAIPDPKQEGSSGKFVLTVDIVGDNATYHWEKIDREGETTTTE